MTTANIGILLTTRRRLAATQPSLETVFHLLQAIDAVQQTQPRCAPMHLSQHELTTIINGYQLMWRVFEQMGLHLRREVCGSPFNAQWGWYVQWDGHAVRGPFQTLDAALHAAAQALHEGGTG